MPVVDEDGNEKRRKKRVLPFVEDRRNILVVTLDEPLPEPVALSFLARWSAASRRRSSWRTPS